MEVWTVVANRYFYAFYLFSSCSRSRSRSCSHTYARRDNCTEQKAGVNCLVQESQLLIITNSKVEFCRAKYTIQLKTRRFDGFENRFHTFDVFNHNFLVSLLTLIWLRTFNGLNSTLQQDKQLCLSETLISCFTKFCHIKK